MLHAHPYPYSNHQRHNSPLMHITHIDSCISYKQKSLHTDVKAPNKVNIHTLFVW